MKKAFLWVLLPVLMHVCSIRNHETQFITHTHTCLPLFVASPVSDEGGRKDKQTCVDATRTSPPTRGCRIKIEKKNLHMWHHVGVQKPGESR